MAAASGPAPLLGSGCAAIAGTVSVLGPFSLPSSDLDLARLPVAFAACLASPCSQITMVSDLTGAMKLHNVPCLLETIVCW